MKVLILSDIHGNWTALRAVLAAEPEVDAYLCLGDLVDYGPQPVECVQWAAETFQRGWFLQGNHDWAVACGEDPRCSSAYRQLAEATMKFTRRLLDGAALRFLERLSPQTTFDLDGFRCFACHGTPQDPLFRYFNYHHPQTVHLEVESAGSPDFLFLGHTHLPCQFRSFATHIVNPGSVGQPKDGDARAAYAVWDQGAIELRRVPYDIEETIAAFREEHLSRRDIRRLAEVLRTGGRLPGENEVPPGD